MAGVFNVRIKGKTRVLRKVKSVLEGIRRSAIKKSVEIIDTAQKNIFANMDAGGRPSVPLHPFTVEVKGNSNPFKETGFYRSSFKFKVTTESDGKMKFFFGIPSGTKMADGRDLIRNVALPLELGNVQRITPKMRNFLFFKLGMEGLYRFNPDGTMSPSKKWIFLPARPHIGPALDHAREKDFRGMKHIILNKFRSFK